METPWRQAVAEVEGWTDFCQTAKPWVEKVLSGKIPAGRMQSYPDQLRVYGVNAMYLKCGQQVSEKLATVE